jgi:hypothetical protein
MNHSGAPAGKRLSSLKGRIGEALVENILHRAGYKIARAGRENQVQQMLKTGISEFLPDFLVWKPTDAAIKGGPLHKVLSIEVKYRHNIPEYLARFGAAFLSDVAEQWPDLHIVLVTDDPEPGRSCFQALNLRGYEPSSPLATRDLYEVPELGIFRSTVEEYEQLAKQIFSLLAAQLPDRWRVRKPLGKVTGYDGDWQDAGAGSQ